MGVRNLRIGLDSNVFRNRRFLDWLRHVGEFKIHISIIVYIETLLWYYRIGLSEEDYNDDLDKLGVEVVDLDRRIASLTVENILKYGSKLPFKHHARDYIIGSTAQFMKSTLITYNLSHFQWLTDLKINVMTPEELILEYMYP
ncbi:MAG TPA: PIN domain-containing protein [Thermoprotei archaeon]|nr:PIN domain-containing protein [Thermoprotei archaeon]